MIEAGVVKAAASLLETIGMDTDLRRAGASWYEGACPFCGGEDRFQVREHDGAGGAAGWFCRQCSPSGGDVLDYVMRRDRVSLPEAIEALARGAGIVDTDPELLARRMEGLARRREEALERERAARAEAADALKRAWAERDLARRLAEHSDVVAGLIGGGLTAEAIEWFRFGYREIPVQGIDGLAPALSIPWGRHQGDDYELFGLQYRILGDAPGGRYRWAKGSASRGRVFNEDAATDPVDDTLVVVEGAKKACAVWAHGARSVVGLTNRAGWAGVLDRQEMVDALGAFRRVVFALDPDAYADGCEAARTIPNGRVARMPMKPDDMLAASGDIDLLWAFVDAARIP